MYIGDEPEYIHIHGVHNSTLYVPTSTPIITVNEDTVVLSYLQFNLILTGDEVTFNRTTSYYSIGIGRRGKLLTYKHT